MAGWTANVKDWDEFTASWNACLSEKPSIQYYKTSEANSLSGQFYRFATETMEAKREALARVIASRDLNGYFAMVPHKAFASRPSKLRRLMSTRIYDWAFMSIICGVLGDYVGRGHTFETIDFTFDGCSELRACIESYEHLRKGFPLSMRAIAGEVIPGDDTKIIPLQAADLLAGGISSELRNGSCKYLRVMKEARRIVPLASHRPPQLELLFQYARQVCARAELAHKMVRLLKQKGVKLDDFK
jgi:hypothetical protein